MKLEKRPIYNRSDAFPMLRTIKQRNAFTGTYKYYGGSCQLPINKVIGL